MVVDKDVCERLRDKDVWDRWMCVKEAAAEEAADEEEVAGYRIKNKNPTQRCGECWSVAFRRLCAHPDFPQPFVRT